jgi:hypothetical protein
VQQQIAGDFKEEVAEKENSKEQSVLLTGDGFIVNAANPMLIRSRKQTT